ncbi:hypothetical protein X943_001930 [Babesia divergens]|uniref:Uncharacterized protein n=1 Tax=Babesia divergens TaxID=32595 RepID=A0AAD9LI82_BABDI|nr:hypothetical protein X943_001930 [Babesia divergens]
MTKNRRIVFYYDFGEDAFKSGYVDASLHRCVSPSFSRQFCRQIKASWTYESSNRKEACTLRQRDIVTVNVVVAAGCITLAVGILGTSMRRSFQIPHRSGCTLGNVIKKPCIFGAPFFMLHDIGDSLSIPELTEFNL